VYRAEIVHTPHACLTGRIAARLAGSCKTVYTKHTLAAGEAGGKHRQSCT
jgi:hypothetical protein